MTTVHKLIVAWMLVEALGHLFLTTRGTYTVTRRPLYHVIAAATCATFAWYLSLL